ncbi:hypothetical protein [Micromonospora carbonacea]|uniref:hypothetical protein n=1 Tax=Micromonospora carbonacea TaxID=47853 RepID=UPI00210BB413|nr:hypothetical protein [Micromonospora carbonacea]
MIVRVVREVPGCHPPYGWTWIEAYVLDARGQAVAKRELFVLREGLRWLAAYSRTRAPAPHGPVGSARRARVS